ncbi:DUF2971 domain-containing protein [Corynebacterium guangdongense]|uniref:DUF2971 domain-containing protein n=1 Tax=Corynebacterium guangdongense TaxID=1783348 RepID=A0ABU1ZWJ2_9CORY|nr:DUF2971 domain-containing protein [Corynebacterium guangdongense]MDR7328738.1 hypothetical protein [Corynebacterium guangdongense]WJZ17315.1 hypothetical protein CGUA_03600 [Corynebacterium guangdongense]
MVPDTVWHYTRYSAFQSILTSQRLWATSVFKMEDKTEIHYGASLVKEALSELDATGELPKSKSLWFRNTKFVTSHIDNTFALSTSPRVDSDHQWKNYADRGQGVAFSLSTRSRLHDASPENGVRFHRSGPMAPGWYPIEYGWRNQVNMVKRAILDGPSFAAQGGKSARAINILLPLRTTLALLKHPYYSSEEEVRFLYSMDPSVADVLKRSDTGAPFVPLVSVKNEFPWSPQPLAISEVRLGEDFRGSKDEVRALLKKAGLDNCTISRAG